MTAESSRPVFHTVSRDKVKNPLVESRGVELGEEYQSFSQPTWVKTNKGGEIIMVPWSTVVTRRKSGLLGILGKEEQVRVPTVVMLTGDLKYISKVAFDPKGQGLDWMVGKPDYTGKPIGMKTYVTGFKGKMKVNKDGSFDLKVNPGTKARAAEIRPVPLSGIELKKDEVSPPVLISNNPTYISVGANLVPIEVAFDGTNATVKKGDQTIISQSDGVTVGREEGNDIVMVNPNVSRKHATIFAAGSFARVVNSGKNGTSILSRL